MLDITSKICRRFIIPVFPILRNLRLSLLHDEASEIENINIIGWYACLTKVSLRTWEFSKRSILVSTDSFSYNQNKYGF